MLTESEKRNILIRAKARNFAFDVRSNFGFAQPVPEDIQEWLQDDEIPDFFAYLKQFGLQRREHDKKWEVATGNSSN
jgi:hypothetical protein